MCSDKFTNFGKHKLWLLVKLWDIFCFWLDVKMLLIQLYPKASIKTSIWFNILNKILHSTVHKYPWIFLPGIWTDWNQSLHMEVAVTWWESSCKVLQVKILFSPYLFQVDQIGHESDGEKNTVTQNWRFRIFRVSYCQSKTDVFWIYFQLPRSVLLVKFCRISIVLVSDSFFWRIKNILAFHFTAVIRLEHR